jgi:hypothetical protein|tara:strand:+ start:594 stop:845 length:252 start_codon:yes stop_codon:yes gene_type:complete
MNEHHTYDIYYDKEGDFLEVSFGEPASEGTTEEIEKGVFVTRNVDTKKIKNIGVLDFKRRPEILNEILKRVGVSLPIEVSVNE